MLVPQKQHWKYLDDLDVHDGLGQASRITGPADISDTQAEHFLLGLFKKLRAQRDEEYWRGLLL